MRAKLNNVRLSYDGGSTWALDGVTLEIAQGERLCILGANGSGKSTLAQVLAGLEAPDEGTVELAGSIAFDGKAPHAQSYRQARHQTGLVFQNPEDQIVTSIAADDVAFGPENLGVEHQDIVKRVDEELARVALGDFADKDPARFSGGQQQRLALAGMLAMHPDMLVLDEPGAMLDVRGRRGIMRVLKELQAQGSTLVHITHFLDEALEASRVLVMSAGRIILEGTPGEVFSHTQELIEAGLLPAQNQSDSSQQPLTKGSSAATNAQTSALSVCNVSYSYGEVPALTNISFEARPGTVTALIGHTGSGKSTLARLMCALDQPSSGSIDICGISTANKKQRRKLRGTIGYVMQMPERQLFAETVFDDIAFGPRNLHLPSDEVTKRVEEQLEHFRLTSKREKSPFELSGGQQRLVAIAGVLAMEPQVLVLDEPTAGLDPTGAYRIKNLVRELAQSGKTILMITHSMDNVAELADYVIALNRGTVALEGTPDEVFAQAEKLHEIGLGTPSKRAPQHGEGVQPC